MYLTGSSRSLRASKAKSDFSASWRREAQEELLEVAPKGKGDPVNPSRLS
jgi:hypothetical protein